VSVSGTAPVVVIALVTSGPDAAAGNAAPQFAQK
jgi:hypothetical protein